MKRNILSNGLYLLVVLSILLSALGAPAAATKTLAGATNMLYLPVMNQQVKNILGAEATPINVNTGIVQLRQNGGNWTKSNDFMLWAAVESVQGTYDWAAAKSFEDALIMANKLGLTMILTIKGTPAWAQKVAGHSCGPMTPATLPAFGNFVNAAVARYSRPPFNVHFWELMNESDIDPIDVQADSMFGCWGNMQDPDYGGGYFAEMLKAAYPRMKAADPSAVIMAGGLMLDCGPLTPAGCPRLKFLDGILKNGGGSNMDALSFHVYEYYLNKPGQFYNQGWGSRWDKEGTSVGTKATYLRSVLSSYSFPNMPLFITEVALLCNPNHYTPFDPNACLNDQFDDTKAVYMARAAADALKSDIKALVWYKVRTAFDACSGASISTWCYTGLIKNDLSLRPGMRALKVSADVFTRASLTTSGLYQANIYSYQFDRSDRTVIMMSNQLSTPQVINLTTMPTSIYNMIGDSVQITTTLTITSTPLYIEWKH